MSSFVMGLLHRYHCYVRYAKLETYVEIQEEFEEFETLPDAVTSLRRFPLSLSYLLATAQAPMSIFFTGPRGEMSKSKMSIGRPSVMQAFGIYVHLESECAHTHSTNQERKNYQGEPTSTNPATCP